jgi:SAM-dependent methyltransferase
MLAKTFAGAEEGIRHLDFGGGSGLLSAILLDAGWQSASYDPFVDDDLRLDDFGKFDLITSFEVFEHVPNPRKLASDLASMLDDNGLLLFSTLLTDGNIVPGAPLRWWYASPRNGHISLCSRQSLVDLGARKASNTASSPTICTRIGNLPTWARRLFPGQV